MAVAEDGTTSMNLKENSSLTTPTEDQTDMFDTNQNEKKVKSTNQTEKK